MTTQTERVDVLSVLNRLSAPVARESVTRLECESVYDVVVELIDIQRGCRDALREAAKQFRLDGCRGHAAVCESHAEVASACLARIGGAQ